MLLSTLLRWGILPPLPSPTLLPTFASPFLLRISEPLSTTAKGTTTQGERTRIWASSGSTKHITGVHVATIQGSKNKIDLAVTAPYCSRLT